MYTPTPKKLPSGSYTLQIRTEAGRKSITAKTSKECLAQYMEIKLGLKRVQQTAKGSLQLTEAIDAWIAENEERLSPSTLRGYRTAQRNGFRTLMHMKCTAITPSVVAKAINREQKQYSAKTVTNRWRFLQQVLEWATGEKIVPALPKYERPDVEFLDADELKTFLRYIKGTDVEIIALLALSSLRRSEIAGLDWDRGSIDLKYRWIRVRGAVVPGEDNVMRYKPLNKNSASRRDVPIVEPLYEALMAVEGKHGAVVKLHPTTMMCRINRACAAAGVPQVGCHGLRHSFASLCHLQHIPEQAAMAIGGWSDRTTMDRIYTHVSRREKGSYANQFVALVDQMANETADEKEKPIVPQQV